MPSMIFYLLSLPQVLGEELRPPLSPGQFSPMATTQWVSHMQCLERDLLLMEGSVDQRPYTEDRMRLDHLAHFFLLNDRLTDVKRVRTMIARCYWDFLLRIDDASRRPALFHQSKFYP